MKLVTRAFLIIGVNQQIINMKKILSILPIVIIGWVNILAAQETAECVPPHNVSTYNITATSFGLKWNPVTNASQYLISIFDTTIENYQALSTTGDTSIYITGLTIGSSYSLSIQTICANGDTSSSAFITIATSDNDTCQYTIEMTDTYGDGWNSATLSLFTDDDENVATFSWNYDYWGDLDGYKTSRSFSCAGRMVRLLWKRGVYDGECGFVIKDAAGFPIITGIGGWYPEGTDWTNASMISFNIYDVYGQLIHNALIEYNTYGWESLPAIEIFSMPFPCLADSNAINHVYYTPSDHGTIWATSGAMTLFNGQMVGDSATIFIHATPSEGYAFDSLTIVMSNDTSIVTTIPYALIVTDDVFIKACYHRLPTPDLQAAWLSTPDSVVIAQPFIVKWILYNSGTADISDRYVSDRIFYNGTEIGVFNGQLSLSAGDSIERTAIIQLPCTTDSIGCLSIVTDYSNMVDESNDTNNTANSHNFTITRPVMTEVAGLVPSNDSVISHGNIVLRWNAVENAMGYQVYVWQNGQQHPTSPTYTTCVPNVIVHYYDNNSVYNWKVVAVNLCDTATSPIQHYAIFKQPILTIENPSIAFGEVEYNASSQEYIRITGRNLTDSIQLSLQGLDSSMFTLGQQTISRYGGSVAVTFTPTALKRKFDAAVVVSSGTLHDTVHLSGLLANYYNFTASVPNSILPPVTPVPITGTLTNTVNVPQANVPVDIWVSVMGRTSIITDTTDSQGHFGCTYTPVLSECGYYEVGVCLHGDNSRTTLTTFNIPGISINATSLPTWAVEQYDTVRGSISIRNRCGVTLHNIMVSGSQLPSGLNVVFDTLTLAPFQEDSLRYTLVGTVYSTGSIYENVHLVCNSNEGSLSQLSLYYYCHMPIPDLQISFDSLYCSVVPGTQKVVDVALFNNTDSTFNDVQIQVPDGQSTIQLLQRDSVYSIEPHDSIYVHLLVSVPEDANWGIATGSMLVTAENTQPQYVPYTINPVSDATGSLTVLVSNEFTYYNNGPQVSGASVTIVGYYSLDTIAIGVTGDDGFATFDSLPEGYYNVHVNAPGNSGYTKITRIIAGETTYLDVDLEFEAITYEWIAYQVGEEDEYELVLNTEFKTNIPKPVITIDLPVVDIPLDGSMGIFNMVISNHGLIDSYDATIEMPQSSRYEYFPLFDRVDTLHALSSIVVPCGVRDKVIYDSVESIKNMGNYYIDTNWSVSSHQQLRTTYYDSTTLVPTGLYIDDSTGSEQWSYDTMLVTIPHYVTESVFDSSISHVIYREAGTNEVLLDIDMNPLSNKNAKGVNRSTNKSKDWWVDCESTEVDKVAVATWWTCNTETKKDQFHQLVIYKWKGTKTKCQVENIIRNTSQVSLRITQAELVGMGDGDCPFMYGRLELCYGRKEHNETRTEIVEEGCKPCWQTIWKQMALDLPQDYIQSALLCLILTGIDGVFGGSITPVVSLACSQWIYWGTFIIKEIKKCADFSICIGTVDECLSKGKETSVKVSSLAKPVSNTSTVEEFERLMSIVAHYYYHQQSEWTRMVGDSLAVFEEHPEILHQIVYYLSTTDSATVEGLTQCYDTTVTVIDTNTLRQYADRWNRTITYSRYGWTNPSQVLHGFSQDFYYPDTNNLIALTNLKKAALQEGFESVEELFVSTIEAMKNHKAKKSTCASVTLQFRQKAAMTREAFEGQLRINNSNDTAAIQGFTANFTVTDTLGHDFTDRFDIRIISREGVDSTGNIAANSSGTITVRFVPLMSAAPTEPLPYLFGGEISYINPFTSLPKSDELNPVRLTVNPSPHLQFDYFVPHDIIADDPLTSPVIETSIPATIGLRLLNDGKGVANNVRASSISPQITENRQGLVVDFSIVGAMLNGVNTSQPLNDIDLGTVNPNGVHTSEYSFLSSLLGTLSIVDIDIIHNSSIDDKDISLVDARAHRLVKPILQYGQGVDAIHDFLTDDIGNGYNLPDSLYFSDGTQTVVHTADTTTFDHYVEPNDTVVLVTLYPDSIGWNYGETADPGRGKYEIISCVRDDNTVIPLENIWLTFVDLPTDEDPVYVNKLHLADTLSVIQPTSYNVTFCRLPKSLDIDTILNVPSSLLLNPLDSILVRFNKAIVDSTFTYADMSLKCNNGANLMDNTVEVHRIDDSTFSVMLAHKNIQSGFYVLKVMADSVVDADGRWGVGGKQTQWMRLNDDPSGDTVIYVKLGVVGDSIFSKEEQSMVVTHPEVTHVKLGFRVEPTAERIELYDADENLIGTFDDSAEPSMIYRLTTGTYIVRAIFFNGDTFQQTLNFENVIHY